MLATEQSASLRLASKRCATGEISQQNNSWTKLLFDVHMEPGIARALQTNAPQNCWFTLSTLWSFYRFASTESCEEKLKQKILSLRPHWWWTLLTEFCHSSFFLFFYFEYLSTVWTDPGCISGRSDTIRVFEVQNPVFPGSIFESLVAPYWKKILFSPVFP